MQEPLVEPETSAQPHADLGAQDMQSMLDAGNLLRLNTVDHMKEEREGREKQIRIMPYTLTLTIKTSRLFYLQSLCVFKGVADLIDELMSSDSKFCSMHLNHCWRTWCCVFLSQSSMVTKLAILSRSYHVRPFCELESNKRGCLLKK